MTTTTIDQDKRASVRPSSDQFQTVYCGVLPSHGSAAYRQVDRLFARHRLVQRDLLTDNPALQSALEAERIALADLGAGRPVAGGCITAWSRWTMPPATVAA